MNSLFASCCIGLVVAQCVVPRRYAFVPLTVAACQLPNAPVLEVGVSFSVVKLLILVGLLRAVLDGRRSLAPRQPLDMTMAAWACWAVLSAAFHHPRDSNPLTIRASLAYDIFAYLYGRAFLRTSEDLFRFARTLALALVPLAALMLVEATTGNNLYTALGVPLSAMREGGIRASGPFGHPILAGTVGAVCLPLVLLNRKLWLEC